MHYVMETEKIGFRLCVWSPLWSGGGLGGFTSAEEGAPVDDSSGSLWYCTSAVTMHTASVQGRRSEIVRTKWKYAAEPAVATARAV